mmetsp:Transcript_28817/g.56594  ORF Transcript_28817/g.56594 Transcript_28817/m.56594 type:complete len:271 (+) Transcript_28817:14-826(+)
MECFSTFGVALVAGMVSSIPIAGPTSMIVFSRGLQGMIDSTRLIAAGASLGEGAYAGLALYGFSKYLAHHPGVLWISKLLAALLCFVLGLHFSRWHVSKKITKKDLERGVVSPSKDKPLVKSNSAASSNTNSSSSGNSNTTRYNPDQQGITTLSLSELSKWLLYGLSLTAFNPVLAVTWAGVISTLMGSEMLEKKSSSLCFGVGVAAGIQVWFNMLLIFLAKLKIKDAKLEQIIHGMGWLLFCVGVGMVANIVWGQTTDGLSDYNSTVVS